MPAKDAEIPTDDERSSIERFIEAYDQAWVDARDTSRNIEDDGFHPSILGGYTGKCGRRNVYLLRSVEKRGFIDPRIQRVFGNGHGVHDRIQKLLHTMGIDFKDETEVKTDKFGPPISGHADGEAQWEGEGILIEIKSCSDEVFVNRLKWKKPKDEHFDQCNIYALVLGYKKIWIIYENKNCVPDSARILTRSGWKNHWDLVNGEDIMTYNYDLHQLEWEQYSGNKLVYHMEDEPIYRVGNKQASFLATDKHRWAVQNGKGEMEVRYTDELNSNSWIPYHAHYFDQRSAWSDYEAGVLGWWATDGWTDGRQYVIYQSKDEGREALRSLLDPEEYTERVYEGDYKSGQISHFYLTGSLRDKLRSMIVSKSRMPEVVGSMGRSQLEAFYRGALGGDGSWSSSGLGVQFGQLDGPVKEAFQIACTLTGRRLNLNEGKVSCYPGSREWMRTHKPVEERYTGDVWCPQTKNGFWLMEQDGKVVVTGNTQETKIFERKASPEKAMKIIDKWYAEWLCHQDGELPKRPYKIGSPTCAGCDVAYHCLPDNEIGVDIKPYTDKVKKIRKEENEDQDEE